jgi:hypothetical protein
MRPHELLDTSAPFLLALLLATVMALSGCDESTNGVDGDGDDDDPSPNLPARVRVGSEADLNVAFAPDDTMSIDYSLSAEWTLATDNLSIEQGGIYVESGAARFGAFQIGIATPIARIAGSHFAAGAWFLNAGPSGIRTEVIPDADGGGTPGVALSYVENGLPSGDSTLVWGDFIDPEAGAPDWIERAAFGYLTLGAAVRHLSLAISDLRYAVDLDQQLVQAGTAGVTTGGAPYPGSGETGAMTCRWLDSNFSGTLGPTDGFSYSRHHWWLPGPGPDRGFVLSGDWALRNYIENRDPLIAVGGELLFTGLQWDAARRDGGIWSVATPGVTVVGTGAVYMQEKR